MKGRLPTTFNNIFSKNTSIRYDFRKNDDKVNIPFRRLKTWGTDTLRYQGAVIHNNIVNLGLHKINSKCTFKSKLKLTYLNSYV